MVGARPQFVKLAPVARAFAAAGVEHVVVHTGQHYDAAMSDAFFEGLDLPEPDHNLEVGSATHGAQTGAILAGTEQVLAEDRPDWVLVYGDTNSTLAAALASVKLGIPTAHLEAGLRSHNRSMPEEINRVLTDHACDLLLAPTEAAVANLDGEGLADRCLNIGDVMADLCLSVAREASTGAPVAGGAPGYVVATIHRPSNTDDPQRLTRLVEALATIPVPVRLLVHPRLEELAARAGLMLEQGSITPMEPQPYLRTMELVAGARGIVTDSGGLQKEAYLLGTPCVTLRAETEWQETLVDGWNILDPEASGLADLAVRNRPAGTRPPYFGDGEAAARLVQALRHGIQREG